MSDLGHLLARLDSVPAPRAADPLDPLREATAEANAAARRRDRVMRETIAAGAPVAHVAEALGVTRHTVYARLRKGETL